MPKKSNREVVLWAGEKLALIYDQFRNSAKYDNPKEIVKFACEYMRRLEDEARVYLKLTDGRTGKTYVAGREFARSVAAKAARLHKALLQRRKHDRQSIIGGAPKLAWVILESMEIGFAQRDLERERATRNPLYRSLADRVQLEFSRARMEHPELNVTKWRMMAAIETGASFGTIRRHTPQK